MKGRDVIGGGAGGRPLRRAWREETRLTVFATVAILGIGTLAAVSLYMLNTLYERSVQAGAAQEAAQLGMQMALRIAELPVLSSAAPREREWREFSRILQSFDRFFPILEYVTVTEGDQVLFQERLGEPGSWSSRPTHLLVGAIPRMGRQVLTLDGQAVPVVTFSLDIGTPEGVVRTVEVALRREAHSDEASESRAVRFQMFRMSLTTVAVGFIASVLIVGWLIRRELRRTEWRRQQEHLAFAGAIATGIIHDFRNPMSSLRLDLQLLVKEVEKGEAASRERLRELSRRAQNAVDRLDDLLKESQHLARPDREQWTMVDINAVAADCARLVASRFSRAGVVLSLDLAPGRLWVMAGETALKRALLNLLVNAEQASPKEGCVWLRTCLENRTVVIQVADQGPGVPPGMRKAIFEMFVTTKPSGFGLGLPLARAAVESFGGTLTVRGHEGGGALFEIRLPVAEGVSTSAGRPTIEKAV